MSSIGLSAGRSVTESLDRHADVFPRYFMALLGSAELTGRMDEAFDQLHPTSAAMWNSAALCARR